MASRILGVDLGAYSVKVAVSSPGFRSSQLTDVVERRVPEGDEPHIMRACAVAGEILSGLRREDDAVFVSIAGDKVFLHILEFGFKSLRRSDLERAVGAELEGVLPIDLEDMVYAFEQVPRVPELALPGADADASGAAVAPDPNFVGEGTKTIQVGGTTKTVQLGRVAAPVMGMRVLAAATQRTRAHELLIALREQGVEAQGLLAAPAPYARLAEKISSAEHDASPIAVLDIGHMRSDFCVAQNGKPIFARSIARGGHHLTRALANAWNLPYLQAEETKHTSAFVASRSLPATTEAEVQVSELVEKEVTILMRDLRRTLKACRAKTGFAPSRVVLLGGGSRLQGLAPFLSERLRIPVGLVKQEVAIAILGAAASSCPLDVSSLALGVAFDGASARPSFDLRQGALAYKADLSFLRTRLKSLGIAAVAVAGFGVLSAYTGVSKLRDAEKVLDRRVTLESAEAFGEELTAKEVLARVGPVEGGGIVSPIPSRTAYDMLLDFNSALPGKDKVVLDVSDISIKPGKMVVQAVSAPFGETSALQGIKNLQSKLRETECFKDFSDPESQPVKDKRKFTLTINTECDSGR